MSSLTNKLSLPHDKFIKITSAEQHALNILERTTTNTNNCYTVGLLWDDDNVELPENEKLALTYLFSLERKFKNHPMEQTSYKDTIQEYISQGHASKLSKTEVKIRTHTTNYLPYHPVKNIKNQIRLRLLLMQMLKLKASH